MRKIKEKERRVRGHIYCPYCKPQKVEAIWRNGMTHVACELHKGNIEDDPREYAEADYQTWLRL